jgi:hypothetical protein
MRRGFGPLFCCLLAGPAFAQVPTFSYLTEFPAQGPPLAIAADANGGIYYTVFDFAGPNLSRCYYVADPLKANALENQILVDDADETEEPAGRGFTGVAVDSKGNIFLALESGNALTGTVRKLSPAPQFAPVEEFGGGVFQAGKRYNGIDVMNDEMICISTFDTVEFWSALDAGPLYQVGGGETYQRDLAYNPHTGDIYIAKNRDVHGEPVSSANLLTGGSADNLEGYTEIVPDFIPQGGEGGQYGVNAQLIEYDSVNNLIIIPQRSGGAMGIAFYRPTDTSTPVVLLTASESPNGTMNDPADAVAVQTKTGDTLVYITDRTPNRILVYTTGAPSEVWGWEVF